MAVLPGWTPDGLGRVLPAAIVIATLAFAPAATDAAAASSPIATGPCPILKRAKHHRARGHHPRTAAHSRTRTPSKRKRRLKPVCPKIINTARRGTITSSHTVALTTADDARPRKTGNYQGEADRALNPELESFVPPEPGPPRPPSKRGAPTEPHIATAAFAPTATAASPIVKVFESHHPGLNAWETSGASDGSTVMFTGNWWAWGSINGGASFFSLDPYSFMSDSNPPGTPAGFDGGFCCDQVVQYDPRTDLFIWLLQASIPFRTALDPQTGKQVDVTVPHVTNTIRIAVATSTQFYASKGKSWTYWDFYPSDFGLKDAWLDYSDLAIGQNDLIWSVNAIGTGGSLMTRIPLAELKKGGTIPYEWFWDGGSMKPAQGTGTRTYFAREKSDSKLTFYFWDEGSGTIFGKDVDIPTIAQDDYDTKFPDKTLAIASTSKINSSIQTAAQTGNEVWFAWSGGRKVRGKDTWKQPHTEIAVIDAPSRTLDRMEYMYSPDHVWVWPGFSVNDQGEIGASFVWGGNDLYTQYVVGVMTGFRWVTDVTTGKNASGGHYITTRPHYPLGHCFAGFGFGQNPVGVTNDGYYAIFGRVGSQCDLPQLVAPLPPGVIVTPPPPPPPPPPPVKPTLIVDSLSIPPGTQQPQFTIKNTGDGASGPSTARSQIGQDPATAYSYQVPGLQPGATSQPYTVTTGCPSGQQLSVTADAANSNDDPNRVNKTKTLTCP